MSGLFRVPYPLFFLKGYLTTLPVFYANLPCDITVYQGLLLLKLPAILVLLCLSCSPRAQHSTDNFHALTFRLLRSTEHSNKLSSFNGFHTQKGLCAKRLWFFRRWTFDIFLCYHLIGVFISFWFVKTELSATFSARAHKDITLRKLIKNAQDIFCLLLYL